MADGVDIPYFGGCKADERRLSPSDEQVGGIGNDDMLVDG
jgi:hypothetical protein